MSNPLARQSGIQTVTGVGLVRLDPKDDTSPEVQVIASHRQWTYGRWDYEVTPAAGRGATWKRSDKITWVSGPFDADGRPVDQRSPRRVREDAEALAAR